MKITLDNLIEQRNSLKQLKEIFTDYKLERE